MDFDESLLDDFVAESREHLDSIEPDLLEMEKAGSNASAEVLNRVFRAIHSIKGAAGFFAFESLKRLSHTMENVLMPVRDGELEITPEMMDVLLTAVDKLRVMIDDVQASDDVPCEDEIAKLNSFLGAEDDSTEEKSDTGAADAKKNDSEYRIKLDLGTDEVRSALKHGQRVYEIVANLRHDLHNREQTPEDFTETVESVGHCLAFPPNISELEDRLDEDIAFSFLFATVLEKDLVCSALGLTAGQVIEIDTAEIKKQLQAEQAGGQEPQSSSDDTGRVLPLGEILIKLGTAPAHVARALQKQADGDKRKLGEILVEKGFVVEETINEALRLQKVQKANVSEQANQPVPEPKNSKKPENASQPRPKSKAKSETTETLRVRVPLLTRLMNTAGELVLGRNQLLSALDRHSDAIPGLAAILQNVDHVTTELQEGIMQTRMQPIGSVFSRFGRVVRDIARQLGKEIDLQTEGSEVELDKSIIELLSDPLTHIVRNCADHAIELPDEREKAGKRRTGKIILRAYHEGGQVNISVSDDGRGIDTDKVLTKAVEKGVVAKADAGKMSHREIVNLIFAPGFSTADVVTDVSGRGVGMDVVRTNIEKLGGHINVDTAVGKGTTVTLRLPLTLAIIPALVVGVEGCRFAVPQVNLVELVCVRAADVKKRIESVHGASVLRLRGKLLPLVRLTDVLDIAGTYDDPGTAEPLVSERERVPDRRSPSDSKDKSDAAASNRQIVQRSGNDRREDWKSDYNILVLQVGTNQFGVIVDELFGSEEIVVKPLSNFLKNCVCFAGATIMGDGRVIMILDAGGLSRQANLHFSDLKSEEDRRQAEQDKEDAGAGAGRRSIILFASADGDFFAVPQEKVLRLERIKASDIERVGSREFIQYRRAGLPLVRLDEYLPVKPLPGDISEMYLVIPKQPDADSAQQARGGIVASKIVDAMDVVVRLQAASITGPGAEGSAIVKDRLTLFLDPIKLLDAAGIDYEGKAAA